MNAPCSLNQGTIRICTSEDASPPYYAGITPSMGPCEARLGADLHSLEVLHPTNGWTPRPLTGLNSWCKARHDDKINIELCLNGEWKQTESWDEFLNVVRP